MADSLSLPYSWLPTPLPPLAQTPVNTFMVFLIGVMAVLIRTYNNGYPEGAMLAVLLMNTMAPLIDWCVVQANVRRRMQRLAKD